MKVFLDANILVSVLRQEYPFFIYTGRIINLPNIDFQLFTSPVCVAIAYYFASKRFGRKESKKRMAELFKRLTICGCGLDEVTQSFDNKQVEDLEDGIEYYAALKAGCTCLVTENTNDFYFAEIEILTSQAFFDKYINLQ